MQVKVNCKKKPIDFTSADFRSAVRTRCQAKKSFDAEMSREAAGTITLTKVGGLQKFPLTATNTLALTFFLDGDRPYFEAITQGAADKTFSFLVAPVEDSVSMGQDGVIKFRGELDELASRAGISVVEVIDPNPVGLCPDGVDDMESLIEKRLIENADILYAGQVDTSAFIAQDDDTVDEDAFVDDDTFDPYAAYGKEDYADDYEDEKGEEDFPARPALGDIQVLELADVEEDDSIVEDDEVDVDADLIEALDEIDHMYKFFDEEEIEDLPAEYFNDILTADVDNDRDGDYDDVDNEDTVDTEVAEPMNIQEIMHSSVETMESVPAAASTEEKEFAEKKAAAEKALDEGYTALREFSESLQAEKQRCLDQVRQLSDQLGQKDSADIVEAATSVVDTAPATAPVVPASSVSIASDEPTEVASALHAELDRLTDVADEVESELNDFDDVLSTAKEKQRQFIDNIETMDGGTSAVVSGLISALQEQQDYNEQLNAAMKQEQVRKRHCTDQLGEAYKQIEDQKSEIDKMRRSLRFSEANQRKSEKFVEDAKKDIKKVIAATRKKVKEALKACEEMQSQVEAAESAAAAAEERRSAAEMARIEAYKARDAAMASLEEEKAHTQTIINEFDRQLDEFTGDTLSKIQKQIDRANEAEEAVASANKRISSLESELAATKTKLMAAESRCTKKDVDINELRKRCQTAEAEMGDLALRFNAQNTNLEDTGRALSETERELVAMRAKIKKIEKERDKAKEDRDAAIAERLSIVKDIQDKSNSAVAAAEASRNAAVADVIGAKDDAIVANQQFITAMSEAIHMSDSFGSRKKKIDAITRAYNEFVNATREADIRGDVGVNDTGSADTDSIYDKSVTDEIMASLSDDD